MKQLCRRIDELPALVLGALVFSPIFAFLCGPHQLSDWLWRPLFVQGCVGANWNGPEADAWLHVCNEAYWKRVTLAANGWR